MTTEVASTSDLAIPPGETLREELEARSVTQRELARLVGRAPQTINAIIAGRQAITPGMALALEFALDGISARFWLNLQADYDLATLRGRKFH